MNPDLADAIAFQVGAELQVERARAGVNLDDLALDTGLSKASLSIYLARKRVTPLSAFLRICQALDVEPTEVLSRARDAVTATH